MDAVLKGWVACRSIPRPSNGVGVLCGTLVDTVDEGQVGGSRVHWHVSMRGTRLVLILRNGINRMSSVNSNHVSN